MRCHHGWSRGLKILNFGKLQIARKGLSSIQTAAKIFHKFQHFALTMRANLVPNASQRNSSLLNMVDVAVMKDAVLKYTDTIKYQFSTCLQ